MWAPVLLLTPSVLLAAVGSNGCQRQEAGQEVAQQTDGEDWTRFSMAPVTRTGTSRGRKQDYDT